MIRAASRLLLAIVRLELFRLLDRPLLWLFMHARGHRRVRRQVQRLAFWLAMQAPGLPAT